MKASIKTGNLKLVKIQPNEVPDEVRSEAMRKVQEAEEYTRQYGDMRPIVHTVFKGYDVVAIGNKMMLGHWKTFPDFLWAYIKEVVGKDWGQNEIKKPEEERHQIIQWYVGACKFQQKQKIRKDGLYCAVANGDLAAYLLLAYDLYILSHNVSVQKKLIERLKHKDQFQGARYEIFCTSTCIKAGFDIEFEDESDSSQKHVEFIATHRKTGIKLSVEAKSKHRRGVLGFPGERESGRIKAGIRRLLNSAFDKEHKYPLVIFVDLNLPPDIAGKTLGIPLTDSMKEIMHKIKKTDSGNDIFNLLFFTNHPHHYGREDEPDPRKDVIAMKGHKPMQLLQNDLQIMNDLFDAINFYNRIPNEFPHKKVIPRE